MRLVHSCSPFEEVCILFDQDNRPAEVFFWHENDLSADCICCARALKSIKSGWFLDLSDGRTAYLNTPKRYFKSDGTVSDRPLGQGDKILVQIKRPKTQEKEAEACTKISLADNAVVFFPQENQLSFSKKLPPDSIVRLREQFHGESVLFRTAAQTESLESLRIKITDLKKTWHEILKQSTKTGILYRPLKDIFRLTALYKENLSEIVTDDPDTSTCLKAMFPNVVFRLNGVWETENIPEALDEALKVKTILPSGGFLITEQTAACVCFDVNAGTGTTVDANNEACVEILRQIRLKGLGGQMIVDFAGNKEKKFLLKMMDRLNSPAVFVKGFSSLGLVELVVEKRKSSLFDVFDESRKHYRTAADLIRKLWFASSRGALSVYAPLPVLNYIRPYLSRLEERLKIDVNLYASEYIRLEGLKE